MKYPTIFHLISSVFNKKAITCVLIGGFAVNYHNVTRATADVDFLTTKEDFDKILGLLKEKGFKEDYIHEVFARLKSEKEHYIDLDFMFVDKDVLEKIIKDGKEAVIAGQKFIVPSVFHLIALKLHAIKDNKKREYKDLLDIMDLIRNNEIDVNGKEFKELCLKYGTELLYKRIIEHIG